MRKDRISGLILALVVLFGIASVLECTSGIQVEAASDIVGDDRNLVTFASASVSNEEKIYSYLRNDLGLNCAAACSVLANIYKESTFRPDAHNVAEDAWGICQWRGTRLAELQKRYPTSWKTLESQLNFLKDEFNGADYAGPKTWKYLKELSDTSEGAKDGAWYFAKYFERCASSTYGVREMWAVTDHNSRHISSGDKTLPNISDVKITNKTKTGYTVQCTVKDNSALSYVQFATWTPQIGGQDDLTWSKTDVSGKSGQLSYRVNVSEHNNEYADYITEIFVYDDRGNARSAQISCSLKLNQVISAYSVKKVYGAKEFSLGAKTSGNGKLTYQSSNNKVVTVSQSGKVKVQGIGTAKITIRASETLNYEGTEKIIKVTILPKSTVISSVKNSKSKKLSVRWKRNALVSGYKVQVSTNPVFKNAKTYKVTSNKTLSKTFSVSKGKIYYVRICTYKGSLYSGWSNVKKIRIKK